MASGAAVSEDLTFVPEYSVTLTETGLPAGMEWSATVGGVADARETSSLDWELPQGVYGFEDHPGRRLTRSPPPPANIYLGVLRRDPLRWCSPRWRPP